MLIFLSYLFMAALPDLGLAVPEMAGICGWIIIMLAVCQVDNKAGEATFLASPAFILLTAALFRALFVLRAPELSDDIYRYLFDGLMTVAGNNPYLDAPRKIIPLTPQMEELVPLINHAHLVTIYPPAAQVVFAAGVLIAKFSGISVLAAMKLLLVVFDLLTCAIILNILTIFNLSKKRALLYAWHPLPVIEIAASGHIDAAAVFFLIAAAALVISVSPAVKKGVKFAQYKTTVVVILAGIFAALSVLTKWLPLVFLPGLWLIVAPGGRRWFVFAGLAAAAVLVWPFLPEFVNGLNTLSTYLQNWEFSGFAFRQLRQLSGSGKTARLILAAGFMVIIGLAFLRQRRDNSRQRLMKCFFAIALAWVLLTPTLHPWYALYLAVFLPFAGGAGMTLSGLTLSWSVFLAYRVLIPFRLQGVWAEDDFTALLIAAAPALTYAALWGAGLVNIRLSRRLRRQVNKRKTPVGAG